MTVKRISQIHGVANATLSDLIRQGKSFTGRGKAIGKYFSMVEEEMLADKMKNLAMAGHEITWANMLDMVKQELIRTGRKQLDPNISFVRRFAKRHNLKNFINRKTVALHMWPPLDSHPDDKLF